MSDKTPQSTNFEFHKSVSPEERAEILETIDKMVSETKRPAPQGASVLEPKKKGFVFPLLINILAIIAVAGGFFMSNRLFEQRQESSAQETQYYLSAEGKLLEELKKESEQKLAAKDDEIGKIQDELADLDRKSAELAANMEATIEAKEENLRREMEAALEEERQRLSQEGTSEEEIKAQLEALQNELAKNNNQAIESFRIESEAAIAAQREELEQTKALNQALLDQANDEKIRLVSESAEREAELTSQFQEEKAALEAETLQARSQLETLSRSQEQQSLLQDQINGAYQSLLSKVGIQEYEMALEELTSLRTMLVSDGIQSIPAIAQRQAVDLFLLDTLQNDIESRRGLANTDSSALLAAAERLIAAEEAAERGLEALENGDSQGAQNYFNGALERLPTLAKGLSDLKALDQATRVNEMTAAIEAGKTQQTAGNWEEAAQNFLAAARKSGEDSGQLTEETLALLNALYIGQIETETSNRESAEANFQTRLNRETRRLEQEREKSTTLAQSVREQESAVENIRIASRAALEEEQRNSAKALEEALAAESLANEEALASEKTLALATLEAAIAEEKVIQAELEAALSEAQSKSTEELNTERANSGETAAESEARVVELSAEIDSLSVALAQREAEYLSTVQEIEEMHQEALNNLTLNSEATLEENRTEHQSILEETQNRYETALTELQEELDIAKEQIAETPEVVVNAMEERIADLTRSFNSLKIRMDRLVNSGTSADARTAEILLSNFLNSEAGDILPGASSIIEQTRKRSAENLASEVLVAAYDEGRIDAFNDVLLYTDNLANGGSSNEIAAKSSQDSLYAKTIRDIQILVSESGEEKESDALVISTEILGTVSQVSGRDITIDSLLDRGIEVGTPISIRRKSRTRGEVFVAAGEITSVSGGRIKAELNANFTPVEIADLVYIVTD